MAAEIRKDIRPAETSARSGPVGCPRRAVFAPRNFNPRSLRRSRPPLMARLWSSLERLGVRTLFAGPLLPHEEGPPFAGRADPPDGSWLPSRNNRPIRGSDRVDRPNYRSMQAGSNRRVGAVLIQDSHSTAALVGSAFVAILRSNPTAQDFGHFILRPQVAPDVPAFRASPLRTFVVRSDPAGPTRRTPANLFVQVGLNSEHGWELLAHAAEARLDLWGCRFWLKTDVGAPLRQGPVSPLYNGAVVPFEFGPWHQHSRTLRAH